MPSWIVRILFSPAAPIAALPVSRDFLNFERIQTMVFQILVNWARSSTGSKHKLLERLTNAKFPQLSQ